MKEISPSIFRRFPFRPKVKSNSIFAGSFRSNRAGGGQEFYSLRPYQAGDEARKIHWKHYAKTGELNIREDVAESNARVWVVCDLSTSMQFGEKPALVAGFSAFIEDFLLQGNNSVGCIGYSDKIRLFDKPQTGRRGVSSTRALLREIEINEKSIMNISVACAALAKHTRRGDVVFLVSDFLSGEDITSPLNDLSLNLEVIPVVIRDPRENIDTSQARVSFRDMETGKVLATSRNIRLREYDKHLKEFFLSLYIDPLWIEGACYYDAVSCIVEWLSRRNKILR